MTSPTYIEEIELNVKEMEEVIAPALTSNHNEMLVSDEIKAGAEGRKRRNNVCKLLASRWLRALVLISFVAFPLTIALTYRTPGVAAQGGCTPAPSGLVGWWPGNGNTDDIPGSNNGMLTNGATFAPGKVGQAFSFTANQNSAVSIPSSSNLNPTRITIEAWVKPSSFPTTGSAVVRKESQYILMAGNGVTAGVPHCNVLLPGGNPSGPNPLPLNVWSHLACTYDGSMVQLYVNGAQVAASSTTGSIPGGTRNLYIGKLENSSARNFDGLIDEVAIYNRALTSSEIRGIYNTASAGKCHPGSSTQPDAANDTATTKEDTAVIIAVLDNDFDPNGDPLTLTEFTQGSNGSVVNHGDGTVTYKPNANFNGSDSFSYTISDGNGGTDTATVTVTVESVNDCPAATDDPATTFKDTAVTINVLANDTDPEPNQYLRITGFGTYPANGTANYYTNGTVIYTPKAGFYGTDTFSYVVSDGICSDSATVTVTVNNPLRDASFVRQTVDTNMISGRQYPISITMRNTGSATWSAGDYSLISQKPFVNNDWWGVSRVGLPASVAPGEEVTFTFMVTAPLPEQYIFQWQMMYSPDGGQHWFGFGSSTDALNITVTQ